MTTAERLLSFLANGFTLFMAGLGLLGYLELPKIDNLTFRDFATPVKIFMLLSLLILHAISYYFVVKYLFDKIKNQNFFMPFLFLLYPLIYLYTYSSFFDIVMKKPDWLGPGLLVAALPAVIYGVTTFSITVPKDEQTAEYLGGFLVFFGGLFFLYSCVMLFSY